MRKSVPRKKAVVFEESNNDDNIPAFSPPAPPNPPPPAPPPPLQLNDQPHSQLIPRGIMKTQPPDEMDIWPRQTQATNLGQLLSGSVLKKQKEKLRSKSTKISSPVTLEREGLMETSSGQQYLNLVAAMDYLQTQSITADLVALHFSGIEQMSDALFFIWSDGTVRMPNIRTLNFAGCHKLTDAGVQWLVKCFEGIENVDLTGCSKLTEKSLLAIIGAWASSLASINMSGTSVAMVPQLYGGSLKLNGCPLISPTEKIYRERELRMAEKTSRKATEHSCFKMVILTEKSLPWSPLAVLTREKDKKAKNQLTVKMNAGPFGNNYFNMFEVPIETGLADLLVSPGCVVVLPYKMDNGQTDPHISNHLNAAVGNITAKCKECVFIFLGLTDQPDLLSVPEKEKTISYVRDSYGSLGKYKHATKVKMAKIEDDLDKSTQRCIGKKFIRRLLNFPAQTLLANGQTLLNSVSQLVSEESNAETLHTASMGIEGENRDAVDNLLIKVISIRNLVFPWYNMAYQNELKSASSTVEKLSFSVQPLKELYQTTVPQQIKSDFSDNISISHMDKLLQFMNTSGRALYIPHIDGKPALTNFAALETIYRQMFLTAAPHKVSLRSLGEDVGCWTKGDLESLAQKTKAEPTTLTTLLEQEGILIKFPRDHWTVELTDPCVYVPYQEIPDLPVPPLSTYWPEPLPQGETQIDRYLTFVPGIPVSFFPNLIRHCLKLGRFQMVWKRGIVIQKGPITVLIELMNNFHDMPVIIVSVRLPAKGSTVIGSAHERLVKDDNSNTDPAFMNATWATLKTYLCVIKNLTQQYQIFAKESFPCEECTKDHKSRSAIVKDIVVFQVPIEQASGQQVAGRALTCRIDKTGINFPKLLGPTILFKKLVPEHSYLGCLPEFSAYNRCMMCGYCGFEGPNCHGNLKNGQTALNCSCQQDAQMCDKCGLCQRCVMYLANLEMNLYPWFQDNGSAVSLTAGSEHKLEEELSPVYSPMLVVTFHRGAHLNIKVYIGTTELCYDTGNGIITLKDPIKKDEKQSEDRLWQCHEGDTVNIQLMLPSVDLDEMVIVIRLQGQEIYTLPVTTQSCSVTMVAKNPMFTVITLPQIMHRSKPGMDMFGQKVYCNTTSQANKLTIESIQASLMSSKDHIEELLFQTGGINYSGSSMLTLPSNLSRQLMRYPSFQAIKSDFLYHLLCYTRTKISEVMTVGMTAPVPESWSVYRMLHLIDDAGIQMDEQKQREIEIEAAHLLWAWNLLMIHKPKIDLPKVTNHLLPAELQAPADSPEGIQVAVGIHDLLWLSFWRICLSLDLDNINAAFSETESLSTQVKVLVDCTDANIDTIGLKRTVSKFNEMNFLYLCSGHTASMCVEEGLSEILPDVFGSYAQFLLSVDLPSNKLTRLPEDTFSVLVNLREFDCSNNYLEEIPASIGSCKSMYSLGLSDNNLSQLPDTMVECSQLFRLEISNNLFTEIPSVVTKLKNLKRLFSSHMMMTSLPENIGNLESLEKLYINGNCFSSLPSSFRKLKNLEDLGISGVPWVTVLKNSKVLSYENFVKFLSSRRIERWLEAHNEDRLELFKHFDADANGTLDVQELGKLNAAIFNMFPRFGYKGQEPPEDDMPSGFPEEIFSLEKLQYLNIYYHGFVSVPEGIGQLTQLKILNVSHNPNLLSLSSQIGSLSNLQRLELDHVPLLKTPPKEIRQKGFASTFAYLQRLQSGSSPCKRTKLMMVGLGGAGKTSLVKSLLSENQKADLTHGEAITDGIDICTWTVSTGEDDITYSVWDFAGQTVYYNTHQFFLSNRAVYLLLWNVRLGYEHAGLDFWLSSISVQAPKAPIFVVGSHVDQVSKYELPINEMRARYRQIAGFHFVSSFTGQGVNELKEHLFDVTLQQEYMGEQIPDVWLTFEQNVTKDRGKTDVVDFRDVERTANISGIFEKSEVYQAVQFLHDLGSLQHFTTEFLKSKVVINPQWIVDAMACVVSVKNSGVKNGRVHHSEIALVWKQYPENIHSWLLRLTEEYDLTFPLQNESVNLVPCLLEKDPEFTWPAIQKDSDVKENKMIYKFDYLPAGLFNRGQVRLHQLSDSATIWKKGSLLHKNGHRALVKQTRDSELVVLVQGPRPENVLFLVHEVFEGLISESFRGVTYDFLLPCPDCLRLVVKDPHMFNASTIRRALELKAPFLQCVKYFHTISCVDLLACMPPDNHTDFDLHLVQSVRGLRDLCKDLAADVFISFCSKDAPSSRSGIIHPAKVCEDLQKVGYKCWFPVATSHRSMEDMARALTDAAVFVAFMSVNYANDEECANIFKYARLTLKKPMVVVAAGEGFQWQQSKLGIHLADEVFVNMTNSKLSHYETKFQELVKALEERTNKKAGKLALPTCFFSYTWVNSAQAVSAGTRSVPGAIGYGDPREIKAYLEKKGINCWIDVERVGMNGLFDDIAEGLLSAKVVVVCVSDEYASSPTCQIEFRYAANTLKLPIILAVVGKGQVWRASEVGILSLGSPLVSFQEKSETAHNTLLELVKATLARTGGEDNNKQTKHKENEENKNLSFQELFELAQRKLLRQLMFYAEHQDTGAYPRLFMVDFLKDQSDEEEPAEIPDTDTGSSSSLPGLLRKRVLIKKVSELKSAFKMQQFCVHVLCEHDEGWHSVADPVLLPDDFGTSSLEKFSPVLARMSAIMKYNKQLNLKCTKGPLGEDFMKWLEESPLATMSDYQAVYHEFRQIIIEADVNRTLGKLARCRLPNGKTIWLCEKHRNLMKVTILSDEVMDSGHKGDSTGDTDNMITGLRALDHGKFANRFKSSRKSKRIPEDPDQAEKQAKLERSVKSTVEAVKSGKPVTKAAVSQSTASKSTGEKKDDIEDIEKKDLGTEKPGTEQQTSVPTIVDSTEEENQHKKGMKTQISEVEALQSASHSDAKQQSKQDGPQKIQPQESQPTKQTEKAQSTSTDKYHFSEMAAAKSKQDQGKQGGSHDLDDPIDVEVSEHAQRRTVQRMVSSTNLTKQKTKTCIIM